MTLKAPRLPLFAAGELYLRIMQYAIILHIYALLHSFLLYLVVYDVA